MQLETISLCMPYWITAFMMALGSSVVDVGLNKLCV